MGFNSRLKYNQKTMAATATTAVAAGSTVSGASTNIVAMDRIAPGTTMVAKVTMVVNTTSLTLAPQWQGSNDGTNWENLYQPNSAANVATAAGTGSNVTTARSIMLPVLPYKYVRMTWLTAGATAHATNDTVAVSYHWIERD